MQARPKVGLIFVVALIVSLILGACGGGTTGKTWFNLPSAKVHIQADGSMRVWGLNVGFFPQPALIQQMQAADIQQLELRTGYNGIHVYANGQDLPYLEWDAASVETLQAILPQLGIANAELIADALPWLRRIGLGAKLMLPLADGAAVQEIARWSGETSINSGAIAETTFGPVVIGSLTFDPEGNASIEGVPVATLEQALGTAIPIALPANVLGMLQNLAAEVVTVHLTPTGIDLSLGDNRPLPGIAYDSEYLSRLTTFLPAFVADPALIETINQAVPVLAGADVTLAVSFTGEQAAETQLVPVVVTLGEDGTVNLFGIPVAPDAVPADLIATLQSANVQQLAVSFNDTGLFLATNGQPLPSVTWTAESLDLVAQIAGPLTGLGAEGLTSILGIATGLGPAVRVNIPPAAGAAAVEIPAEIDFTIAPPEANPEAPTLRLTGALDAQGNVTQIGGFTAEEISQLGVTLPTLPPDLVNTLRSTGAQEVQVDMQPGALIVRLDGADAIQVNYDTASLTNALNIAAPFTMDTALAEPAIDQLLREQLLPLLPTTDLDITISLQ